MFASEYYFVVEYFLIDQHVIFLETKYVCIINKRGFTYTFLF